MGNNEHVNIQGIEVSIVSHRKDDYISLTDMAGYKNGTEARIVISNWMSTYYTLEYMAIWEDFNNPNFNRMGYQSVRNTEGRLIISPKRWIKATNKGAGCCYLCIGSRFIKHSTVWNDGCRMACSKP